MAETRARVSRVSDVGYSRVRRTGFGLNTESLIAATPRFQPDRLTPSREDGLLVLDGVVLNDDAADRDVRVNGTLPRG